VRIRRLVPALAAVASLTVGLAAAPAGAAGVIDNKLVGTWNLTGLSIDGGAVTACPGTPATDPVVAAIFACKAGESLALKASSAYSETISAISAVDDGHWLAGKAGPRSIIVFDDSNDLNAPRAYVYALKGKNLTISLSMVTRRTGTPSSPKSLFTMHFAKA